MASCCVTYRNFKARVCVAVKHVPPNFIFVCEFYLYGFHNNLNNHRDIAEPVNQKANSPCWLFYSIYIDKGVYKSEKCEDIEMKRSVFVFFGTQGSVK